MKIGKLGSPLLVVTPLKPMPERQVSLDSFGGDADAYQKWLDAQAIPAEV
ncbi:hypothetical protein [Spirulina sp. CCNP1310]|nr:hypothetical protein [Spirulina sp. CCNP1310]